MHLLPQRLIIETLCFTVSQERITASAARLVTMSRKSDHITPLILQLHWLTVEQRIDFKVLLVTLRRCKARLLSNQ